VDARYALDFVVVQNILDLGLQHLCYGRILAKVLLNDRDMNLEQVRAGFAWHYKKYQKEQTPEDRELYSKAELEAREAGRGLWRDPAPLPPWEQRKRK
jgi:endonuclease YncB( thermonuclease family)